MRNIINKLKSLNSEKILATVFLLFCFYVGLAALPAFMRSTADAIEQNTPLAEYIEIIDSQYSGMLTTERNQELLHNKATYINLNGLVAGILDQQVVNERVKLTNGHLTNFGAPYDPETVAALSENLYEFYAVQQEKGKNFLFVLSPTQTFGQEAFYPAGFTDNVKRNGDLLIQLLQAKGVPFLDLREKMDQAGITYTDGFFVTDHHWTLQTAFWAYTELMSTLEEMGSVHNVESHLLDPDSFEFRTYEDSFLGSSGKRTGIYFGGVDDFSLLIPKFDTDVSVSIPGRKTEKAGRYEDVAYFLPLEEIVSELMDPDYFNVNPYGYFGNSDTAITHWRNKTASQDKKFLLIGDSMANIPFSLLPLSIYSCDELDMRYFRQDFMIYYNEYDPDTVIIFVNVGSLLASDGQNISYDFVP